MLLMMGKDQTSMTLITENTLYDSSHVSSSILGDGGSYDYYSRTEVQQSLYYESDTGVNLNDSVYDPDMQGIVNDLFDNGMI